MTLDWNKRHERRPEPATATGTTGTVISHNDQDTAYGLRALEREAAVVASTPTGSRNDGLNRAWTRMGSLVQGGNLTFETARQTLISAARQSGLPDTEIETVLRTDATSGFAAGALNPRTPTPMTNLPDLTIIDEPDATLVHDFWQARPILTHLHDYARARCVAPWAVLGNALTRVICAAHPSLALPPIVGGPASLNLFVGIVGRSGTGKGAAEAVAKEALDVGPIHVRNTGSGEGVVHAYMKRLKDGSIDQHTNAVLFSIPEIDTLGAVGARQGATLMPLLRSAWSGEQLGFQYADPTKNMVVPAHKYRLCLVAGIQPGRAGTILDHEDGGTPQRFLWLPATDTNAPTDMPAAPDPITWDMRQPMTVSANGLRMFDVCATARNLIVTTRQTGLRGDGEALDGHGLLTRLKTAGALALFEKRWEVTDEDWELSGVIMGKSDATRSKVIAHRHAELAKSATARALGEAERQIIVGDTVAERAVARVARGILNRLPADTTPLSEARTRVAKRDRDYFDEAIGHLKAAGQIVVDEVEKGHTIRRTEVG